MNGNLYVVQCTVTYQSEDGWQQTVQVPTFILDRNVQGFRDKAGAEAVARDVVNPLKDPNVTVSVSAEQL